MNNILFKTLLLKGEDGNSIASIEKTSTAGLVDTYTITLTDGSTTTFDVTNGQDGADGQDGQDGNGIVSIEKTSTAGLVDTYTITYTHGDTDTFTVTNGSGGGTAGDISFDPTNTSLPSTANTVQKAIEALAPPTVTITITLHGAKEDTITVTDSNNETIGVCVFASGQTSGTITADVPSGYSDTWSFTSSVAQVKSGGTFVNYSKTATIDDTASQSVNVYPDNAIYWYGNFVDSTTFSAYGDQPIERNPAIANITVNTNSVTFNSGSWMGILSNTKHNPSNLNCIASVSTYQMCLRSLPSDTTNAGSNELLPNVTTATPKDEFTRTADGDKYYAVVFHGGGAGEIYAIWGS